MREPKEKIKKKLWALYKKQKNNIKLIIFFNMSGWNFADVRKKVDGRAEKTSLCAEIKISARAENYTAPVLANILFAVAGYYFANVKF